MSAFDLKKFITPIEMNGLRGRVINIPAQYTQAKNVNILFFHGHHSSLERLGGIAEALSDFGNVCIPDMPGFGGMESFYKLDLRPTLDNFADYMAAFIKLQYGTNKKFVVIGYSFGGLVLTRMLQKYPSLRKQVLEIVLFAGFVHHSSFLFSRKRKLGYTLLARTLATRPIALLARGVFMRTWFIGTIHAMTRNAKIKYEGLSSEEYKKIIEFEVKLWRINDVRTRAVTVLEMFKADLLHRATKINKNIITVYVDNDHYFNNSLTNEHLAILFRKVRSFSLPEQKHGVSVVASKNQALSFFPEQLLVHLRSLA